MISSLVISSAPLKGWKKVGGGILSQGFHAGGEMNRRV